MKKPFAVSLDEALESIRRYQIDIAREPTLARTMRQAHAWYALRDVERGWLFAPSRFAGYRQNDAVSYLRGSLDRNGRSTERALRAWFDPVAEGEPLHAELMTALRQLLRRYGHNDVRAGARVSVQRSERAADAPRDVMARIAIDPAICGGRPHVVGTRVRVADILAMLAGGATAEGIVADYPYLVLADVAAVLAYAAASADHRIIEAA